MLLHSESSHANSYNLETSILFYKIADPIDTELFLIKPVTWS